MRPHAALSLVATQPTTGSRSRKERQPGRPASLVPRRRGRCPTWRRPTRLRSTWRSTSGDLTIHGRPSAQGYGPARGPSPARTSLALAFGQAAGPPATAKQLAALAALLEGAGYASFREARHPFGLTQRQANGKFTQDEAAALLDRLEAGSEAGDDPAAGHADQRSDDRRSTARPVPAERPGRHRAPSTAKRTRPSTGASPHAGDVVTAFPDELLAEELGRRGWTCHPPPSRPLP